MKNINYDNYLNVAVESGLAASNIIMEALGVLYLNQLQEIE